MQPQDLATQDRRIIHKRILSGQLREEDLQAYLQTLPDVSRLAEMITVTLEEGEGLGLPARKPEKKDAGDGDA